MFKNYLLEDGLRLLSQNTYDSRACVNFRGVDSFNPDLSQFFIFPGGPGLSNFYLDAFSYDFFQKLKLSSKEWQVQLIDLPFHDLSTCPERPGLSSSNFESIVDKLSMWFEKLVIHPKSKVIFFGHSYGGIIASTLAARHCINGLGLCSTPWQFEQSKDYKKKRREIVSRLSLTKLENPLAVFEALLPLYLSKTNSIANEKLKGWILKDTSLNNISSAHFPSQKDIDQVFQKIKPSSLKKLLISSSDDIILPERNHTRLLKLLSPDLELLLTGGHFLMYESFDLVQSKLIELCRNV